MPRRQSPLKQIGRPAARPPADPEAARADGAIDRTTMRDNPWDPSAVNRSPGCLELASRKPSWPAVNTTAPQAGHMDASDPISLKKLLCHGGRPHMGPCVRRDERGKGENPSARRPCESRGPYAAAVGMGTLEDGFASASDSGSWQSVCDRASSTDHAVWVPAFAGTTERNISGAPHPLADPKRPWTEALPSQPPTRRIPCDGP
jgi:hypothetical protein